MGTVRKSPFAYLGIAHALHAARLAARMSTMSRLRARGHSAVDALGMMMGSMMAHLARAPGKRAACLWDVLFVLQHVAYDSDEEIDGITAKQRDEALAFLWYGSRKARAKLGYATKVNVDDWLIESVRQEIMQGIALDELAPLAAGAIVGGAPDPHVVEKLARFATNGRVFVSSKVAHHSAERKQGEQACHCAACKAGAIVRAARQAVRQPI